MTYLASASAVGTTGSDTVTVSVSGFSGASTVILGVVIPGGSVETITWPSGFTLLTSANNTGGGRGNQANLLIAFGTTVTGSYIMTVQGANGTTPIGFAVAHSGRVSTTPTNFTSTANINGGNSPISLAVPGLTAASGDDILWLGAVNACAAATAWTWTAPSGYTSRQTANVPNSTAGVGVNLSTRDNQNGATGTLTGVATNSGQNADGMGIVLALSAPAIPPPVVVPPPGPMPRQLYVMP